MRYLVFIATVLLCPFIAYGEVTKIEKRIICSIKDYQVSYNGDYWSDSANKVGLALKPTELVIPEDAAEQAHDGLTWLQWSELNDHQRPSLHTYIPSAGEWHFAYLYHSGQRDSPVVIAVNVVRICEEF